MFYGWWIVGALVFISAYAQGIIGLGFTAAIDPIANDTGWSYGQISLAVSIRGVEMGILAPVVGLLIDRIGPRKLQFTGVLLVSIGMLLLGHTNSLLTFFGVFVLIAIGMSTCIGVLPATVVGNWFKRKVSIATGIAMSGVAFGGIFIPIITRLIDIFNWRMAMTILGWISLVLLLPLTLIVRHKPEQYGYLPDGDSYEATSSTGDQVHTQEKEPYIVTAQILKNRFFWHLSLAIMCHVFVIHSVLTHVMPYLNSIAIGRTMQSWVAMALPLSSVLGRLTFGWFGDYFNKKNLTMIGFVLTIIAMLSFGYVTKGGIWLIIPFLVLFGFAYGGPVPMVPALFRENFGADRLGSILGLSQGITVFGTILGPPVAGFIYDFAGSYEWAWFIFAGIVTVGLIFLLTAPTEK